MRQLDPFVGLPWRDRGRTRDGCDCWGLARIVYRELLDIDLPSYVDCYASTADREALDGLISGERGPWIEVTDEAARLYDLVLLRERPWHIGIVAGAGLMLHMPLRQASCIEPYRTGRHRLRISGHYRHRTQA